MATHVHTTSFAAMGSMCHVAITGGSHSVVAALVEQRVRDLESKWSRFLPNSEVSLLNNTNGSPTTVSSDTYLLIDHSVAAWKWTSGRFDPTVYAAMIANGYDRSFVNITSAQLAKGRTASPSPGCQEFVLDEFAKRVTLPSGVGFDPGGIGKGLAADLAVEVAFDAGASGACVNIGGDVRVGGEPPPEGWRIGIANPLDHEQLVCIVKLTDQGLATSNRLIRTWQVDDEVVNHLVDPSTGRSLNGPIAASVIAGQAWWAEALSKLAMVEPGSVRLELLGGEALTFDQHGVGTTTRSFQEFVEPNLELAGKACP